MVVCTFFYVLLVECMFTAKKKCNEWRRPIAIQASGEPERLLSVWGKAVCDAWQPSHEKSLSVREQDSVHQTLKMSGQEEVHPCLCSLAQTGGSTKSSENVETRALVAEMKGINLSRGTGMRF